MYALHTFSTNVMNVWFEHILHKEWSYDIHYSVTLNCLVSETLNHLKSFQKQAPWRSLCSAAPNWLLIVTSVPLLPYLCIFVYHCCFTHVPLFFFTFVSLLSYLWTPVVLPVYFCCHTCVHLLSYLCVFVVLPVYCCCPSVYLYCLTCVTLLSHLCNSVVLPMYLCCTTHALLFSYLCTFVVLPVYLCCLTMYLCCLTCVLQLS